MLAPSGAAVHLRGRDAAFVRRLMAIIQSSLVLLLQALAPALAEPSGPAPASPPPATAPPATAPRPADTPKLADISTQTLMLQMEVNGYDIGKVGEFMLRDGALLARRRELLDLGFRLPTARVSAADPLVALSSIPGLTTRLDLPGQKLFVVASDAVLAPTLLQVGGARRPTGPVESGSGVTFDYDINGTSAGRQTLGTGGFDLRAFSPWGIVSTNALAYAGGASTSGNSGGQTVIRLDSSYSYADPDTLRRYRLGDFISGGLPWTRPIRLGGAQVTLDFGIRPDLVTFPLPSVSGSAAVPSTVDVLVNGTRLFSQNVRAGPFAIPQLPVVTGAGTISTTLINALGQQVVTTLPFYTSAALLSPGLQSFSVQAGAVRRNWGLQSNDYGALAGSATYRRGLTSWLTAEASAEASGDVVMAGAGVVVNVFDLAVLNTAIAGSTGGIAASGAAPIGAGRPGTQFSIGLQRTGPAFSLGASATVADRHFSDLASVNGDPPARLQLNANAGLSLGQFGSVGIAYAGVDRDAKPTPIRLNVLPGSVVGQNTFQLDGIVYLQPAQHAHVVTASYSVQMWNMSFFATGFRDFAHGGSNGLLVGMTVPLSPRSSAGVSAGSGTSGRNAQLQASQSAVTVGDVGYQVLASGGNSSHEFGQLQYKSPWALVTAGVDRIERQNTLRAEAQGSASFLDGSLFLSNTINDAFAVVSTNGLPNVRVLNENREIGRTGASGQLLVPDLRSFDVNHISIEPNDIPSDTSIAVTAKQVRPQDRSGVVVRFGVKVSRGALLHLVDDAGKPLPVGSTATLQATGVTVPVGYDGAAYVEDLAPHNALAVEWPGGQRCAAAFDYAAVPGQIPVIGPLPCRKLAGRDKG